MELASVPTAELLAEVGRRCGSPSPLLLPYYQAQWSWHAPPLVRHIVNELDGKRYALVTFTDDVTNASITYVHMVREDGEVTWYETLIGCRASLVDIRDASNYNCDDAFSYEVFFDFEQMGTIGFATVPVRYVLFYGDGDARKDTRFAAQLPIEHPEILGSLPEKAIADRELTGAWLVLDRFVFADERD